MGPHITLLLTLAATVAAAPKSRSEAPSLVYDQKQKGDYNLQLSVKDLHVIALLSDSVLDIGGDYDYNYDYSDFTIKPKPSTASTTSKPENCTGESDKPTSTTEKDVPKPPASSPAPGAASPHPSTDTPPRPSVAAELESRPPSSTYKPVEDAPPPQTQNSTASLVNDLLPVEGVASKPQGEEGTPDRIKVQIIQSPEAAASPLNSKVETSEEEEQPSPASQLGETLHYRRCLSGFTRDKKGRCRRVRRPGPHSLQFGISRLASNLAALTGATLQYSPSSGESNDA